jgi:hypothetical protein
MKKERIIYMELILCIMFLFIFLNSREPIILFLCLGVLGVFLATIFIIKNYNPKKSHFVAAPILVFQGLTLAYIYIFTLKSPQTPSYIAICYAFGVIWVVTVIVYSYYYYRRNHKK